MLGLAVILSGALAVELDLDDDKSFNDATKQIAAGVFDYYDGQHYGGTVGVMSPPYYWWQSASALSGLLTYGLITGDDQYDEVVYESLLAQSGDNWNFITANQTMVEGNDDQGYWAMFAMEAAERNFKPPPDGKTWVSLSQNVFDEMVTRWDPQCGGGLRWQIFDWNKGYNYKNSVSTGCMFNLAARLARYTHNQTYVDWAYKIYDWMTEVGLITEPSSKTVYHIFDGAGTETNCQEISTAEWSYNYGVFISGMAYLHDLLQDQDTWAERISMAWERADKIFFTNDDTRAMIEPSCQPQNQCNNDQRSFRAPFSRFLGHLVIFNPEYEDEVQKHLRNNANLAAKSCSGGSDGKTCGQDWSKGSWDGVYGLGEQMSALEVILNTRAEKLGKPMQDLTSQDQPHEPQAYAIKVVPGSSSKQEEEHSTSSHSSSSAVPSSSSSTSTADAAVSTPSSSITNEAAPSPTTAGPSTESVNTVPVEVPSDTQVAPQQSNGAKWLSPIRFFYALIFTL